MKRLDAAEAAGLVADGATVAISGGSYRAVAENVLAAVEERFRTAGTPSGLTVVAISMVERARKGVGGAGSGLNRFAHPGMAARVISGSFARNKDHGINQLVTHGGAAGYNLPMGTILQWLRATAAGRTALLTPVGIGTFVDPRLGGGRVDPSSTPELSSLVEVDGEELIRYPRLPVDVGIVKATSADRRGNLFFEREAYDHGSIDVALAAHNSGGLVIAEVNRVVEVGELNPRLGRVPGALVDAVVVAESPWEDEQDPALIGEASGLVPDAAADPVRALVAEAVVRRLPSAAFVNLGAGMPMYDVPPAAARLGRDDLYFTVEQGPMGGWPQPGGAAINPEVILGQSEVFDLYEGGGPDVSVLAFAEIDQAGNVNVSRFGDMLPGTGGFVNIVHGARRLIFCGTFTSGGLVAVPAPDGLRIETEGRVRRFVSRVQQVTFDAAAALRRGASVTYLTERAVLELTAAGLTVVAVTPGIDLQRQVLDLIPFPVAVSGLDEEELIS